MAMQTLIYNITVLTNLHAGSGESGYGIVDKLVQRDAATGLPTIYASGLKGALREYFKNEAKIWLDEVFGKEESGGGSKPGSHRFLSADLVATPVPSDTSPFFARVYDPGHLEALQQKYQLLKNGFTIDTGGCSSSSEQFKEACKELPVIARNHLENGQSRNLWYEEVVPHQSRFIMAIQHEADKSDGDFEKSLDNAIVQVGGNATVGYGLCQFKK
jgi:CRISPR-associated protein Cmr4